MSSCDNKPGLIAVPEGGLWTAADVARYLQVSPDWVWKQIRCKSGLPYFELSPRNYRFDPEAVRAWLAARQGGGAK